MLQTSNCVKTTNFMHFVYFNSLVTNICDACICMYCIKDLCIQCHQISFWCCVSVFRAPVHHFCISIPHLIIACLCECNCIMLQMYCHVLMSQVFVLYFNTAFYSCMSVWVQRNNVCRSAMYVCRIINVYKISVFIVLCTFHFILWGGGRLHTSMDKW